MQVAPADEEAASPLLIDTPASRKPPAEKGSSFAALRRIWAEADFVRPQLALGCVFLLAGSVLFNGLPYLAGQLLDTVTDRRDPEKARSRLNVIALQLVLLAVVSGVASGIRAYLFNSSSERVVARVRQRLFRAILAQEVAFFDTETSGGLLSRISADTETLKDAATTNVSILLRSVANVTVALGAMFATSWQLTLLALLVTPAVAALVIFFGRGLRQLSKDTRNAAAEASSLAGDALGAIRALKSYAKETAESVSFDRAVNRTMELGIKTAVRGSIFQTVVTALVVGEISLVLWYGGLQVIDGATTIGQLQAFVLYVLGGA